MNILRRMRNRSFFLYDTEFTAWNGSVKTSWKNQPRHLLQIAMIKVSPLPQAKILQEHVYYIKPDFYTLHRIYRSNDIDYKYVNDMKSLVDPYITNLTGITHHDINTRGVMLKDFFAEFSKKMIQIDAYSFGSDFEVLRENLDYFDANCKSYYRRMIQENLHDITPVFRLNNQKLIDGYCSGTLYQLYNLTKEDVVEGSSLEKSDQYHEGHNALWDVLSLRKSLINASNR